MFEKISFEGRKFIFVPEEWERNEKDQMAILDVASSSMSLLLNILVMTSVVLGVIYWTNNRITKMLVLYTFVPLFIILLSIRPCISSPFLTIT